jgi:sugar-phosphatase
MRLECDAILFDLDGVLVNSVACVERHWRRWAEEHDLDAEAILRVAHGQKTVETMRHFAPGMDVAQQAAQFAEREASDMDGVFPIPGASDLVKGLPAESWTVVTSGRRTLALARLRHVGLPVPPTLVTADDVERGKPAPDPYLLAAARLVIEPKACVVIEDSPAGIESALASGMRVIGLATTHPQEDLARSDAIVDTLQSLQISARAQGSLRIAIETAA